MSALPRRYKRYQVCGLQIASTIAFPELQALPDSAERPAFDLEFELGGEPLASCPSDTVMTLDQDDGSPWLTCTRTAAGYGFHFPGLADFVVDRLGRKVRCVAPPDTPPETIRHLFLDQVIPPLLNLRGSEALHASAIRIGDGACAFIGMSGQGKSTLAAAFHAAGHTILCDDCLLLHSDPERIAVAPAYPGLRLWGDSRGFLFGHARDTQPVSHYNNKRRIAAAESNAESGALVPLRGIYTLQLDQEGGRLAAPQIQPLSVRDAFIELVSYAFRLDLGDQAMILRQMQFLERVAEKVPVKRLRLPRQLAALAQARALILRDLQAEAEGACA